MNELGENVSGGAIIGGALLAVILAAVFAVLVIVAIIIIIIVVATRIGKHQKFVRSYSSAVLTVKEINSKYKIKTVKSFNMSHSYDNKDFYNDISCQDYLTYQLQFIQKDVRHSMNDAKDNLETFREYSQEIKDTHIIYGHYKADISGYSEKRLLKCEKAEVNRLLLKQPKPFAILVRLTRTNINGVKQESKNRTFNAKEISTILAQFGQKRGSFYLNEDIWHAICRVERGKVTNKMRFSIYERDGYRCRMCGRSGRNNDLEIDHIYPIAKGGKTKYDNLQTLCHKCNQKKGSKILY